LTDGGLETTLIFHEGVDLPEFAAFVLLADADGTDRLLVLPVFYLDIAAGPVLGSSPGPPWRPRLAVGGEARLQPGRARRTEPKAMPSWPGSATATSLL
jgi:hypothetical protein